MAERELIERFDMSRPMDQTDKVRTKPLQIEHDGQNLKPEVRDVVIAGENRHYIAVLGIPSTAEILDNNTVKARVRAKLMALTAEASGSAQRVLRFVFLTAKLSIDTGELTDKGVVSQRNILRRHAALIEELYADNPADHVVCLDRVFEERI
jgi:feruloyl-CoA synthase